MDKNLIQVMDLSLKTRQVPWIVTGLLLSVSSTKVRAQMGTFPDADGYVLIFVVVAISVSLLVGLIPAYFIYLRYKKRWIFFLAPIFGLLILLLYFGFKFLIVSLY